MATLAVGEVFEPICGKPEGVFFEVDDAGFMLIYNFMSPRPDEVASMKAGQPFQIRFLTTDNIIWILSKSGNLEWVDAPYTPHLTKSASLVHPEEGEGVALTLIMTDAADGTIKSIRLIGLGTDFSKALLSEIERVGAEPFNEASYDKALSETMRTFSTRSLCDMAKHKWHL